MNMKKTICAVLALVLAVSLFGCGGKENTTTSNVSSDEFTNNAAAALSGKYDNYIRSFTTDVNSYIIGDFYTLIDGALDGDNDEWRASFNAGAEKAKHWLEEYGAAQIIVPESGMQTYQSIGNVMVALENLFIVYSDLGEAGKGTDAQREEFKEGAEAIRVIWEHEMKTL